MSTETVTVRAKSWWRSKTNIVAFVEMAVGIIEMMSEATYLGDEFVGIALTASGFMKFALRFMTNGPITAGLKSKIVEVKQ